MSRPLEPPSTGKAMWQGNQAAQTRHIFEKRAQRLILLATSYLSRGYPSPCCFESTNGEFRKVEKVSPLKSIRLCPRSEGSPWATVTSWRILYNSHRQSCLAPSGNWVISSSDTTLRLLLTTGITDLAKRQPRRPNRALPCFTL